MAAAEERAGGEQRVPSGTVGVTACLLEVCGCDLQGKQPLLYDVSPVTFSGSESGESWVQWGLRLCWVTERETREADVCKVKMETQRAGRMAQWVKALTCQQVSHPVRSLETW